MSGKRNAGPPPSEPWRSPSWFSSPAAENGLDNPVRSPLLHQIPEPDFYWDRFHRASARFVYVQWKRWKAATTVAIEDLERAANLLVSQLRESVKHAQSQLAANPRASLRDILLDLNVLDDEFPEVRWDLREKTLSVVTEPVTLQEIDLGPFEIRLDLRRLGAPRPYDVIAAEPNPAAGDNSTPHPHVRNDDLCEGEGKAAIQSAIRQGRVLDFFILVRQVLETYNADSAYVPLTRWAGTRCPDCGSTVADDDLSYCEACDSDVCGDCSTSCQGSRCGRSLCGGCADRCADCGESCCSRCLTACPDCEDDYCVGCLTNGRCSDCQEITDNEDDETPTTESRETSEADPALHAVGVGQAAVPPGPE